MNKEKDLIEIKKCYNIVTKNMDIIIDYIYSVYDPFKEKEELNKLIKMCQDFNIKAVTESNNILNKLLNLKK